MLWSVDGPLNSVLVVVPGLHYPRSGEWQFFAYLLWGSATDVR